MERMVRMLFLVVFALCMFEQGVRGEELVDTAIYNQLSRRADSLVGSQFETTGLEWSVSLDRGRYMDIGFTMYADVYYRVVVVSASGERAVRYRLFDVDRNVLYDSEDFGNPSRWDFLLTSTVSLRLNLYGLSNVGRRGKEHILVRIAFCRTDREPKSVQCKLIRE